MDHRTLFDVVRGIPVVRESGIQERLVRQTGHDVAWWNDAIAAEQSESDEPLLDGSNTAGGSVNLRLPLHTVDDLDEEAVGLLRGACEANL
jgi:hypothetical protein